MTLQYICCATFSVRITISDYYLDNDTRNTLAACDRHTGKETPKTDVQKFQIHLICSAGLMYLFLGCTMRSGSNSPKL